MTPGLINLALACIAFIAFIFAICLSIYRYTSDAKSRTFNAVINILLTTTIVLAAIIYLRCN